MLSEKLSDELLSLFRETKGPLKLNEIAKALEIKSDESDYEILKATLDELAEKEIIEKSTRRKYYLKDPAIFTSLKGKIEIANSKGIVFTDDPEFSKIIIRRSNMLTALNGDTVLVKPLAMRRGKKPRGEVIKILERGIEKIVGTIEYDGDFYFLIPDEDTFYVDFLIPQNKLKDAKPGDKVSAKFLRWEDQNKSPQAEIIEVIGKAGDPRTEYDSIIQEFGLPEEFPKEVLDEARQLKMPPAAKKIEGRLDLRDQAIITIDPVDAKDFDDALSLEILDNGNYRLGVHIADVSHYVEENSPIDLEARYRATSVYLVDRVIPMLPERLSNDLCSLRPDEDRLAFSVFMEISKRGAVKNYEINKSVINSKRRYSYEEVLDIIRSGKGDNSDLILKLHELAATLRKKRYREGGIEFDTFEIKYRLDENKYPVEVLLKRTNDATALVEECMLICNRVVAEHIKPLAKKYKIREDLPFLHRIHEDPDPKRIQEAMQFISTFGPKIQKKELTSKDINQVLKAVENRPEKEIVHQILIRSMPKAVYSHRNLGHFGLGFKDYTHFTSPIRRYPDLIIHRLAKEYQKGKPNAERIKWLGLLMKDVGGHSSDRERLAMEAERASIKLTSAVMAENYIGEDFNGTITGVTSFGLFIMLDGFYAEGLLHMRDLHDDYYYYDEKNYRLIGKRHKKVFGFGKRLRVKLAKVNVDKRNIDLLLVDDRPYEEEMNTGI